MKVTGLRDMEKALLTLPAGTAKGVSRRVMKKELKPVAVLANAFWPGSSDLVFKVTSRLARSQPQPKKGQTIVNMFVGADGDTPHAHLVEWGTGPRFHESGKYVGSVAPSPALTPAWESNKAGVLQGLGAGMWAEIVKTQERRAKRAANAA